MVCSFSCSLLPISCCSLWLRSCWSDTDDCILLSSFSSLKATGNADELPGWMISNKKLFWILLQPYLILFGLVLSLYLLQPGLPLFILEQKISGLQITSFTCRSSNNISPLHWPVSSFGVPAFGWLGSASLCSCPRLSRAATEQGWLISRAWLFDSGFLPINENMSNNKKNGDGNKHK